MKKLKNAVCNFMLLSSLLMQGTLSAQAATDDGQLCWPVTPATTTPKNMQEIKELLEQDANKEYFRNVELRSGKADSLSFEILQYLDHTFTADPQGKYALWQRVFITKFIDADSTTVMHTSGYEVKPTSASYYQLAQALKANMIHVEHRYTGQSRPDQFAHKTQGGILENKNYWDFCTANQAADDIAYVVNTLKRLGIFKGKWVATGTSKCGMTTTFQAMYRPSTCDVYVPFCAPFCKTLQDPLYHYVSADYGGRLAGHNKQDSITWDRSFLPVKDYLENPNIQESMKQKLAKFLNGKYNLSGWKDENYKFYFVQRFFHSQWIKATYLHIEHWQQLIPSRLPKNAVPSEEYTDSMFNYLMADERVLYKLMYAYMRKASAPIQRIDHSDDLQEDPFLQPYALRRASAPIEGIDAEIYNASEYYVQTLYELGHLVRDFSCVYDLVGDNLYQRLTRNSLAFNYAGCSRVAENIELDTDTDFYPDPKNPSGPKLNIGLEDNKGPLMPKTPIAPKVREFIKTTQVPILFVYGEFDPWTQSGITDTEVATAANPNVQRYEVPSGTHNDWVLNIFYSSDPNAGQTVINKVKAMLKKVPTAIRTVTTTTAPAADNAIYDLQGRRVTTPTRKGLYIQNGKIILMGR